MKPGNSELGEATFLCKKDINTDHRVCLVVANKCTVVSFGDPRSPLALNFGFEQSIREKSENLDLDLSFL